MNRSFQAYSPRVRPFRYDSLALDIGCQDLPEGNDLFATKAFERICIFEHDSSSLLFNQPDTVTYAYGPVVTGDPMPWSTRWAAYVSSTGIRVLQSPRVDLPSSAGTPSSLYDRSVKPTKLSLGFMPNGYMAIAIQKTPTAIQIKWFKDGSGAVESIGDVTFVGESPALFQNGLVFHSDDADENDLVLYYLRPSEPRKLFARIGREHFTIEHVINDDIQIELAQLIENGVEGRKQALYLRDSLGRDVTLYSHDYAVEVDDDSMDLETEITSGAYAEHAIPADAGEDFSTLSVEFTSGIYYDPIEEAGTLTGDVATLSIAISDGEYL